MGQLFTQINSPRKELTVVFEHCFDSDIRQFVETAYELEYNLADVTGVFMELYEGEMNRTYALFRCAGVKEEIMEDVEKRN